MTDQAQQRADHLALVAAPILANAVHHISQQPEAENLSFEQVVATAAFLNEAALNIAAALQRAAEERVSRE